MQATDQEIRHFIYQSFAKTASPPTCGEIAGRFGLSREQAEQALERLAEAHQIALAPGAYTVWMAHPFSGVKTDFTTRTGGKTYWGN